MYNIHIQFDDGSNPYVRYNMIGDEYKKEIRKWSKNYWLEILNSDGDIIYYLAKEKIEDEE